MGVLRREDGRSMKPTLNTAKPICEDCGEEAKVKLKGRWLCFPDAYNRANWPDDDNETTTERHG